MTPRRERMIEQMQVRNLALHTQRAHVQYASRFAGYFRKSLDLSAQSRSVYSGSI
jgi:hypothetical protein